VDEHDGVAGAPVGVVQPNAVDLDEAAARWVPALGVTRHDVIGDGKGTQGGYADLCGAAARQCFGGCEEVQGNPYDVTGCAIGPWPRLRHKGRASTHTGTGALDP
jgi:hypothetical protein